MIDTAAAYPGEHVTSTSFLIIIAGFLLILGVAILCAFIWMGRGEQNDSGEPDVLGSRVTIREIAARFRTTWSPSTLGVSVADHQKQTPEGIGSVVYKIAWGFLAIWLLMTGVFLIISGVADSIENFREEQQLSASIYILFSLLLCAAWIPVFRIHSKSTKEIVHMQKTIRHLRNVEEIAKDPSGVDPFAPIPDHQELEEGKSAFLWVGFFMLVVAWALALAATVQVRAWTLPSPQYGTMLFVAPGYGLFTGWLLYAASLNFGVAYCADSCPDGVRAVPEGSNAYAYRGSAWPILVAVIALITAVSIPDPTQPVPLVLSLLFFTPRYSSNLWAAAVGILGIVLGTVHVWSVRS